MEECGYFWVLAGFLASKKGWFGGAYCVGLPGERCLRVYVCGVLDQFFGKYG